MTLEQKIDLLLHRQIVLTKFTNARLERAMVSTGIEIGRGKCRAVILRLNQYDRNSTNATLQAVEQAYYGDSQSQEFELLRGVDSELIFCNDLSEVFVRAPEACNIQVLIYS